MTTGAWADDLSESFTTNTGASAYTGQHFKITPHAQGVGGSYGVCIFYDYPATIEALNGETITKVEFTITDIDDVEYLRSDDGTVTYNGNVATVSGVNATSMTVIAETYIYFTAVKVYYTAGPEVSYNDAKTTASFAMPAYDATVSYQLVRDLTISVNAVVTDRIRIQKDASSSTYVAVTATELIPAVSDKISGTAVAMTVTTDYTAQLQKKTEGDTPTWADATTLSVGTFRYVITGTGLYDGEITTNEFQLFEGYEVTVPAGEYITYYKDEALRLDDADKESIELYTISSVTATEAVLSSPFDAMKANTPMLVYNKSTEAKTFLLIPCAEPDLQLTVAPQFVGTLEATTIPASATGADNYALNGYAFVWVKNAIEVAANKCWLHIESQHATSRANTRSITGGGDTTGVDSLNIEDGTLNNGNYYDLNGRKVLNPTKKGIYIKNGKKVIIK